jgi:hypothetical protein
MNQKGFIVAALFVLLAAGAFAAPIITVDKNVTICNKTKCDNSSMVKAGLQNMPDQMTRGIRSIQVRDRTPPSSINQSYQANIDGRLIIYARGMNVSTYRNAVVKGVTEYYQLEKNYEREWQKAQAARKYPLPDWATRPGQCDLGVRMRNSWGDVICVRPGRN